MYVQRCKKEMKLINAMPWTHITCANMTVVFSANFAHL